MSIVQWPAFCCACVQSAPAPALASKAQQQGGESRYLGGVVGASAAGLLGLSGLVHADEAEHGLEAPTFHWPHYGMLSSYDHPS